MNENTTNKVTEETTSTELVTTATTNLTDIFKCTDTVQDNEVRYATVDATTSDLFNALSAPAEKVKDYVDKDIDVTKLVVTTACVSKNYDKRDDVDAEKETRPVVHFFTADGKHISAIGNGIVRTAKFLLASGITPTKETPIRLHFKKHMTRKGETILFEMRDIE